MSQQKTSSPGPSGQRSTVGGRPRQPWRLTDRRAASAAERIVIKIGSSSLTGADGSLNLPQITELARTVSGMVTSGREVIVVSSGAIAAALRPMGLVERPQSFAEQQAAASIGQGLLVKAWSDAFMIYGVHVGQVLLTENDMIRSETYRSVRASLEALLGLRVVPIVNENDTTATHEIRFGDNDRLASLVAQSVGADLLVLLTDVDGLFTKPPHEAGAERISVVPDAARLDGVEIGSTGTRVGTGGMVTKLSAAHNAAITGTATILTVPEQLQQALAGEDVGTFFPAGTGRRRSRLMWLRYATRGVGTLVLDDGAIRAITESRRSLLPVGIVDVRGEFRAGGPVDIEGADGTLYARGLSHFSSADIRAMAGRTSDELRAELGDDHARYVVHRDELVVLTRRD